MVDHDLPHLRRAQTEPASNRGAALPALDEFQDLVVAGGVSTTWWRRLLPLEIADGTVDHALAAADVVHDLRDAHALSVETADQGDLSGGDVRDALRSAHGDLRDCVLSPAPNTFFANQ